MEYVYISALLVLNLLWLLLVVLGLPGTWLMVLSTAGLAWWKPELELFGRWTLVWLTALATLGEVLEFFSGMVGSRKAGGSVWGAIGGLLGALAGGIFGTALIAIPIIGSVFGVCLGAFGGAVAAELLTGKEMSQSVESGRGAAVGRFFGILIKLAVGMAIYATIAVTAFVE